MGHHQPLSFVGRLLGVAVRMMAAVAVSKAETPRPAAVASPMGQDRTNASQHVGAENRDKPQAPQVPAVQNSRFMPPGAICRNGLMRLE
jgi:hypothetical protein